jgi:hypothetical protein
MKKMAAVKRHQPAVGDISKQKKKKTVDDTEVSNDETPEEDLSHNESDEDDSEVSCVNLVNLPFPFHISPK